jgi:pimeloyl-ACP methyl ester carboxylesterase
LNQLEKKAGYINLKEVKIYFEFLNQPWLSENRPLLVFLHEGLGSVAQWKDFPALLCEKTKLPGLLFDREGYGNSSPYTTKNDQDYLKNQAQTAMPEIFRKLNIEQDKKILIGHSDGGSIAIIYAGTYPENIIGLITEASHQFLEDISVTGIREAVKLYEDGKLKELLRKYHGENTDTMFHGWADTWLNEKFGKWNIEQYLENIKAPFLAIQGKDDQYGSYAQLESIKKLAVNSDIYHIPGYGHTPHLQKKDEILQLMSDFILGKAIKNEH